ncbi:hypothetical protein CHUAL_011931 [Chamberlinius hualienensis]
MSANYEHDTKYQMYKNKGKFIIISHKKYDKNYVNKRSNARENVDLIQSTFDLLNFENCGSYTDLSKDAILQKLIEVISTDFTDYSSLFVFILTHGAANYQLAARDGWYSLQMLVNGALQVVLSIGQG